jgi:hypothetical protein
MLEDDQQKWKWLIKNRGQLQPPEKIQIRINGKLSYSLIHGSAAVVIWIYVGSGKNTEFIASLKRV